MTLAQALDYLRQRHNESSSSNPYWTDTEIYSLISARSQIASQVLGLIEQTNTSTTTVSGTQAYTIPTAAISLVAVLYDGKLLQMIDFKEWANEKGNGGTTPSGTPEQAVIWNRQLLLVPIPNAAKTITYYYEGLQTQITDAMGTIELPTSLHYALMDGILADMFAKAQNSGMASFYEQKWSLHMAQTFPKYKWMVKRRSRAGVVLDADTAIGTDHGIS